MRFVVVVLLLIAGPAWAWTNTTSGHGPQSIADGGPSQAQQAVARSSASTGPVTATGGNPVANGGTGGRGGAGGTGGKVVNTITTGGSTDLGGGSGDWGRLPVASAVAPPVYGGICVGQGVGLGAQFPVFGISLGGNQIDRVCQLHMIGADLAAREYLCQADDKIRAAFRATATPCAADVAHVVPAVAPVANQTTPTPSAFVPSPWCAHASRKQRAANTLSCGEPG